MKKIVCIGGGTGTSIVLSGLRKYPVDLKVVATMFDNGGSSGELRKEMGILPLGDIRQCLVALSGNHNFSPFFLYRFNQGKLKGHNLGNLLIAAAVELTGNLTQGIEKISKLLDIQGDVLPVSLEDAHIKAVLKNNEEIKGEENIVNCGYLSEIGIKKLFLDPKVKANPKAVFAIKNADLIIIGPGKFYTSLISNFLIKEIRDAVRNSRAKKVFVCSLMTQQGNTDHFQVEDFVMEMEKYLGKGIIDYNIFNTGRLSSVLIKKVKKVFSEIEFVEYNKDLLNKKNFIGADVLDRCIYKSNPADILVKGANKRTMIFHNSDKLAKIIFNEIL